LLARILARQAAREFFETLPVSKPTASSAISIKKSNTVAKGTATNT